MIGCFMPKGRRELTGAAFPVPWLGLLHQRFPLYRRLGEADRRELQEKILVFLAEKNFEGCGGLSITDEIRVTVAAQACLLLLHRPAKCYAGLRSILVYPSTYFAPSVRHYHGGVTSEEQIALLGESWEHGAVVLAWDSVCGGAANPFDGHNVVLHEFAHQLDQEDGLANGAPVLGRGRPLLERIGLYSSWARILAAEYEQLRRKAGKGRKSVLDRYAASHPAEFFAVATECFFEKPRQLLKKRPQLYGELKRFYCQDPATWTEGPPESGDEPIEPADAGRSTPATDSTAAPTGSRR